MKTKYIISFYFICMLFFLGITFSSAERLDFALTKPLKTEKAHPSEIKGIFEIIFYGARFPDDVETVAILDYEGDEYKIEPFAPDFDFRIKKGIPDKEASQMALKFISFHTSFHKYSLKKIIDNKGKSIGFEFRPLYYPFIYGVSDIMDINYWLKEDGKVKVTIKLLPSVERLQLQRGDNGSGNGGD